MNVSKEEKSKEFKRNFEKYLTKGEVGAIIRVQQHIDN